MRHTRRVDAVPAHFCIERRHRRGIAERFGVADRAARLAHARGELGQLIKTERLGERLDVDARVELELAQITFRHRGQAACERAQLQPRAGSFGRHRVGRTRRVEMPLPAGVTRPAADGGAADAGRGGNLAIGHRRRLDQLLHPRDRGVAVRPARTWVARTRRHVLRDCAEAMLRKGCS